MWTQPLRPLKKNTEGQEALCRALYSAVNKAVKSAHRLLPTSFEVADRLNPPTTGQLLTILVAVICMLLRVNWLLSWRGTPAQL